MLPLQIGLPGMQEFVIILFIFVVIFGAPILLIVLWLSRRSNDDETADRVAELEDEVERLRDQQGTSQDDTRESDT